MKETHHALGAIRQGLLLIADLDGFNDALKAFPDGDVVLTVRRAYVTRSHAQNSYYWTALVGPIAKKTGISPKELHHWLKHKFLPVHVALWDDNGRLVGDSVIGGTTTSLTKREFGDYCDEIRLWALDFLKLDLERYTEGG